MVLADFKSMRMHSMLYNENKEAVGKYTKQIKIDLYGIAQLFYNAYNKSKMNTRIQGGVKL